MKEGRKKKLADGAESAFNIIVGAGMCNKQKGKRKKYRHYFLAGFFRIPHCLNISVSGSFGWVTFTAMRESRHIQTHTHTHTRVLQMD